jgi:hypothetical protein
MELLDSMNYAKTRTEHERARAMLKGWCQGIKDAGAELSLCNADFEYESRGLTRPICAGIFLDWEPTTTEQ